MERGREVDWSLFEIEASKGEFIQIKTNLFHFSHFFCQVSLLSSIAALCIWSAVFII